MPVPPPAYVAYVVIRNNGTRTGSWPAHQRRRPGDVPDGTRPGASVMSTIPSVRIPAHATLAMRPDGVHMLIDGAGPMHGGKDITPDAAFAHGGPVSVVAQVTDPESGGSSYFLN